MNVRRGAIVAIVLIASIAAILGLVASIKPAPPSPLPIVISRLKAPHSGLIHIAEANGYFAEEGLSATIRSIQTGYEAISQTLEGQADVATAAETPIARVLAEGKQIKILSTIFSSQWNSGLVVRKDRGITRPADLRGKRIGYVFGTATHYELETFLAFHHIPLDAVELVKGRPDELVNAITSGEVDAVSVWTPFLTQIQEKLGADAETFSPKEFYSEMTQVVVRADYPKQHSEETSRLLRALLKAEVFAKAHPNEALHLIAAACDLNVNALHGHGEPLTYELALQQSLLLATENQVRWHFRRGTVPPGPFPDVLHAFETAALGAIKPSSVTIAK